MDDIEQRVLDAARALILHYGYDKTTMNDIAQQAGVAKSTIYSRWDSREDLFESLVWRESKRYLADWLERIEADPLGGTFHGMFQHALEAVIESDFMSALYTRERHLLGTLLKRLNLRDIYAQRQQMLTHFLQALQQAGTVRADVNPQTAAYVTNCVQYGFLMMGDMMPPAHAPPYADALALMIEMLDRLLSPEDGGDSAAGKAVLRQYMNEIYQQLEMLEK